MIDLWLFLPVIDQANLGKHASLDFSCCPLMLIFYRDFLLFIVRHYGNTLQYGSKYLYQCMPRMLTVWLDFGSNVPDQGGRLCPSWKLTHKIYICHFRQEEPGAKYNEDNTCATKWGVHECWSYCTLCHYLLSSVFYLEPCFQCVLAYRVYFSRIGFQLPIECVGGSMSFLKTLTSSDLHEINT